MSAECSTEYHTSQQSDHFEEQSNSQTASGDVTTAAGESGSIQNQEILHNNDSQASNALTITFKFAQPRSQHRKPGFVYL